MFEDILSKIGDVSKRTNRLESIEYIRFYPIIGASAYLINTTINAGVTYDSGDLRGTGGVATNAKGFFGSLWITPLDTSADLYISQGDDTPSQFSQRYRWLGAVGEDRQLMSQFILGQFGTGGNIKIKAITSNVTVFINAFGYWK